MARNEGEGDVGICFDRGITIATAFSCQKEPEKGLAKLYSTEDEEYVRSTKRLSGTCRVGSDFWPCEVAAMNQERLIWQQEEPSEQSNLLSWPTVAAISASKYV